MSYLIEPLRDGAPKLQQAYLNIINIIFSVSIHNISNPQQTAEGMLLDECSYRVIISTQYLYRSLVTG
jgi:hypothetical protein